MREKEFSEQLLTSFDPCPLCGKEIRVFMLGDWWILRCDGCKLRLEKHGSLEELAAVWNCRPGAIAAEETEDLFEKTFGKF
jgi:hypothetical protein